jgi:hypothetical protein
MDRGRVEEDRGSKETDGCPLTVDHEGGLLSRRVLSVVVEELAHGQETVPVILSSTCECTQIAFYHLVNALRLTVSLGMVSCRQCQFDP